MQRIERYGVIALVFLLVTILAVSIWGEGQAKDMLAKVKHKASEVTGSIAAQDSDARSSRVVAPGRRRAANRSLPMAEPNESTPRKRGARKGGLRGEESLEDAFVTLEPRRSSAPVPTPAMASARRPAPQRSTASTTPVRATPQRATPVAAHTRNAAARVTTGSRTYVVRAGDTLSQIAQRELGTYKRWGEIQRLNDGLDPAKLRAGMKLQLPGGAPATAARAQQPQARPRAVAAAQSRSKDGSYSVRKGDSLSAISQRELGTASRWKEIAALNPSVDPKRLSVGAVLVMPASARSSAVRSQQVAALAPSERSSRSSGLGRVR